MGVGKVREKAEGWGGGGAVREQAEGWGDRVGRSNFHQDCI